MTTDISVEPALTAALRREIVGLWVDATNAGGSVGFLPPTTAAVVRPVANQMFRQFYARLGWHGVRVMPNNLRMVDGSYRDETYMRLVLTR